MGCRAGGAGTFVGVLQADAARLYPGCMSNVRTAAAPRCFREVARLEAGFMMTKDIQKRSGRLTGQRVPSDLDSVRKL